MIGGKVASGFMAGLALLAALVLQAVPAAAQDERFGSSYITPFPPGDVYKVQLIGDDLAEGLLAGLGEAFATDTRLDIQKKVVSINGLMRPDNAQKLVEAEAAIKAAPPHIAVLMLGAWDRVSLRAPDGRRVAVGSDGWRTEYGARADRLLKMLKRAGVAVYWVGLPNVRKHDANDDAQMMNEILRERIYVNGMKYVDAFAGFINEAGGFDAWGPDITGKIVRLRDGDGVYFTAAGNRKLAHFVEKDLRRDLNQAKADRALPLAGSEAEQAKINPDKARIAEAEKAPGWNAALAAKQPPDGGKPASDAAAAAGSETGEQKADNGKIALKLLNQQTGREEQVVLDIVRPAIPASVVALVTRRESPDRPSRMGETLAAELPGGLTALNTFTPAVGAGTDGNRKVSPAQTPYFRVLFKGERLLPKRGRADDITWMPPQAQSQSLARPPATSASTASPAPGSPLPAAATSGKPAETGAVPARAAGEKKGR